MTGVCIKNLTGNRLLSVAVEWENGERNGVRSRLLAPFLWRSGCVGIAIGTLD